MSALAELGEFGLIERITKKLFQDENVLVGVGDDCAIIRLGSETLLVSCDACLENIHFRRTWATPADIGYKAAACALSDIAAMGGTAKYLLISLACPMSTEVGWVEELYQGLQSAICEENVCLVGGDTCRSESTIMLDVTVIGVGGKHIARRAGAQPGNWVAVTGYPGCSALGYHALKHNIPNPPMQLLEAHRRPRPRLAEGRFLVESGIVTSMIDLSDGLIQDLGHVAKQSNVCITIDTAKLPCSELAKEFAARSEIDWTYTALVGGEDYELAFCLDPTCAEDLLDRFRDLFCCPVTIIGCVEHGQPEVLVDGVLWSKGGFNHFQDVK